MSSFPKVINKSVIISPFCIFHHVDPTTSTYRGIINYPNRIRTNDGQETLECVKIPPEYGQWTLYHTFYAFSPMLRPIPSGLKLINADKIGHAPYTTKKITYAFDPFNINPTAVAFMTWTQPVPGTASLYLYNTPSGDSYPSFDPNPPGPISDGWSQNKLSPIYVLVDSEEYSLSPLIIENQTWTRTLDANNEPLPVWKKDRNGQPIFRFRNSDNRCLPDVNGMTIEQCFLQTDENILGTNLNIGPIPLLQRLRSSMDEKKSVEKNITNFFKNTPHYSIIIVGILFISALISCIIILSKKN